MNWVYITLGVIAFFYLHDKWFKNKKMAVILNGMVAVTLVKTALKLKLERADVKRFKFISNFEIKTEGDDEFTFYALDVEDIHKVITSLSKLRGVTAVKLCVDGKAKLYYNVNDPRLKHLGYLGHYIASRFDA